MIITVRRRAVWLYLMVTPWSLAGAWNDDSGTVMFADGRGCRLALRECVSRFGDHTLGWF